MEIVIAVFGMLFIAALSFMFYALIRAIQMLNHRMEAVEQRFFEGGIDLADKMSTAVRVPEQWRDHEDLEDGQTGVTSPRLDWRDIS